jgi:hypothetical protein
MAALIMSSCDKKIDEAYQNPNAAVREPVETIFPAMIGTMLGNGSAAANSFGLGGDVLNVGRYIQYWNSFQSSTADNSATSFDKMAGVSGSGTSLVNIWGMYYFSQGANLNRIIDWGMEEQKWDFVGAAWALRAWGMLELTNQYGEAILRQAFDASRQTFDYNDQSEFYDSVRVICQRAISYLSQTGGGMNPANFANSDFYFNKGDLGRWKKFAYGVLARSYAYIHNKATYSADSVIKYAALSCATNADNCTLKFANTGVSATKNYFGTTRGNINNSGSGIRQSAFIANLMSGNNPFAFTGTPDPRCWYMLRENPNGTFKGYSPSFSSAINGPALQPGDSCGSFLGTTYLGTGGTNPESGRYIFRNDAEWPIMTASEMQFLLAEAYLRKGMTTESRNAYINGISLNFDMLTDKYTASIPVGKEINAANKAAYLASPAIVPATPDGMTLTAIMLQKYIALYGWGAEETWVDMRRYHYTTDMDPKTNKPVYAGFVVPSGTDLWSGPNGTGSNNGKLVQRVRPSYNSEYLYNIPSLTAIGAYPPGNDYHTKPMWFSQP